MARTPHFLEGLKTGRLHERLGIPEDQKIPVSLLHEKIAELKTKENKTEDETAFERELVLALNFHKFHHK